MITSPPLVRACSSYPFSAGASLQLVPTIKELVALSKKPTAGASLLLVPIHRWCELVARTYSPLVRACSSYLLIAGASLQLVPTATAGASLQLVPTIKELVALSKKF